MKRFLIGFQSELLKLAFHEGWGAGGEWSSSQGSPIPDENVGPLLHEQYVPLDVEYKNARQDYFISRMPTYQTGGKITPGAIGKKSLSAKEQ